MNEQRQNEADPSRKAETLGTRDDGGPAFPRPISESGAEGEFFPAQRGMTLRDYFAAQAMQAKCFQQLAAALAKSIYPSEQRVTLNFTPEAAAADAYAMADAMLAARKGAK